MPVSRCVLHVDDCAAVRHVVRSALETCGIQVVSRESESAALAEHAMNYACAILDIDLCPGDGVGVARHLQGQRNPFPVAFFTSSAASESRAPARAIGPVFEKPDELGPLVRWVERTLADDSQ